MSEPTLSVLENQEPQSQEDLEDELHNITTSLGTTRMFLCLARDEERKLMARRGWVRAQLRLLRTPIEDITVRAEAVQEATPTHSIFNGTTEPTCPDCEIDEL